MKNQQRKVLRFFTLGLLLAFTQYTFAGTITLTARDANTGTNVTGVGTVAWTSPGNVVSNNNSYATVAVTGGAISNYLQATNYGFSIPPEATITGITVTVGRFESSTGIGNDVRDSYVQMIKGGTVVGTNNAVTGTDWPTTEGVATYGGTANMWGTTWTPSDINASNFGVALAVNSTNNRTASVDYIEISITYTGTYLSQFISMNTGSSDWCAGETRTVTVTVKNNGSLTWTNGWPDVNIGIKWNADADYLIRTDANNLAPGATQTYSLTVTAPGAGSNNLTFDAVVEMVSWFAGNGNGVGPGNTVYASPALTIVSGVPGQPGTITGSTTPCFGSSQTYSVTNVAGVTYNWTFPSGWVQTGGTTTNSVTVTVGSGSGNVQVTPSNACGSGTARSLAVTVSNPAAPGVTSPVNYCLDATAVPLTATGTGLLWYTAASGGSGSSTAPTPSTAAGGTTSYWVSQTLSGCESPRAQIDVIVHAPSSSVTGQSNVSCFGGNDGSITIQASGGTAPYQFSITNGVNYSAGANPYTFSGLIANTQYKIRVKDSFGCESPAIP
jgi:trimeric autotransporter adhesin